MPQPSPALGSAPTAPRWSRLSRICRPIAHEFVRLGVVHVGDEADAAGVMLVAGIIKALRRRQAIGGCENHPLLHRGNAGRGGFAARARHRRGLGVGVGGGAKNTRPGQFVHARPSCPSWGSLVPAIPCLLPSPVLPTRRRHATVASGGRRGGRLGCEGSKWSAKLSYLSARDIARLAPATQDVMASQRARKAKVFSLFANGRRNFNRPECFKGRKPLSASKCSCANFSLVVFMA